MTTSSSSPWTERVATSGGARRAYKATGSAAKAKETSSWIAGWTAAAAAERFCPGSGTPGWLAASAAYGTRQAAGAASVKSMVEESGATGGEGRSDKTCDLACRADCVAAQPTSGWRAVG